MPAMQKHTGRGKGCVTVMVCVLRGMAPARSGVMKKSNPCEVNQSVCSALAFLGSIPPALCGTGNRPNFSMLTQQDIPCCDGVCDI